MTNMQQISFPEGDEVSVTFVTEFSTSSGASSGNAVLASKLQMSDHCILVEFTDANGHVFLALVPWHNVGFASSGGPGSVATDFSDLSLDESGAPITVEFVTSGGGIDAFVAESLDMQDIGVTFVMNQSGVEVTRFLPWENVVAIVQEVS
jgi:hypothetical protein